MIVLDTHVLIWLTEGHERLGTKARDLADQALQQDCLSVSAISFWETATLQQRARIRLSQSVETWRLDLLGRGLGEVPVTGDVGIAAATLPDFHGDPADRIITVTAVLQRATLLTADTRILDWSGILSRHDATT